MTQKFIQYVHRKSKVGSSALADVDINGSVRAEPIEGRGSEQVVRGEEQENGIPGSGGVEEPTTHGHRHEAR